MAVIKCPHCGNSISNKAPKCIYCGAPVVKMQKCADCGLEYPEKDEACPSCGCPTSRKAKAYSSSQEEYVDGFLLQNGDKFPVYRYNEIRSWLMTLNLRQLNLLENISYRDSTIMLIVAIFIGLYGGDRFLLKDNKRGVIKLIMALLSFLIIPGVIAIVMWVMDCIKISELTKEYNYNEMRRVVAVM